MSRYCVTFPLITEKYQENILNKRFEISRQLYNAVLSKAYKRYKSMIETKKYRQLKEQINNANEKEKKQLYKQLNDMYKQCRLNEYSLHEDIKNMQHHFSENIDSFTAQKIATRVWTAFEKLLFGNGEIVHFKKYNSLNSLEGKSNKTGIRFKDDFLLWNGLKIPVEIDYTNLYEYEALQDEICFCRIRRKFVKNKFKYYLQIVFKDELPLKINKEIGEINRNN